MRILLLAHSPVRRGAETFAADLARGLAALGEEAKLLFLTDPPGGRAQMDGEVLGAGTGGALDLVRASLRLQRAIARFRPQVLQANGSRTVLVAALTARWSPRRRWKLVYRNIGKPSHWLRSPFHRWFYARWVMPTFDLWVALGHGAARELEQVYGTGAPIRILPQGVAVPPEDQLAPGERQALRASLGVDGTTFVLLFVGSLSPEKRADRLLRVFARFARRPQAPAAELWVVGDGPERDVLHRLAQELEIARRVRFFGVQEEVGRLYGAADVLVLGSDTEGVPAVVPEAMAWGLPVVATDVGWIAERVEHGVTGFLVPPQDEEAFADRLLELARDPELRRRLGQEGRTRVLRFWTLERSVRAYLEVYRELVGQGRGGRRRKLFP